MQLNNGLAFATIRRLFFCTWIAPLLYSWATISTSPRARIVKSTCSRIVQGCLNWRVAYVVFTFIRRCGCLKLGRIFTAIIKVAIERIYLRLLWKNAVIQLTMSREVPYFYDMVDHKPAWLLETREHLGIYHKTFLNSHACCSLMGQKATWQEGGAENKHYHCNKWPG